MSGTSKICAVALGGVVAVLGITAGGAEESEIPARVKWSFAGPFGIYDEAQLQRGLKIYREVCQACHALSRLSFRNLAEPGGPGFSPAQAKAIAAEDKVTDGPNDQGEMFERPGRHAGRWPGLCPGRPRIPAVGGRAAPGRAQAHRPAGDGLSRGIRRVVVFHQEEGVVERARPRVMCRAVVAESS